MELLKNNPTVPVCLCSIEGTDLSALKRQFDGNRTKYVELTCTDSTNSDAFDQTISSAFVVVAALSKGSLKVPSFVQALEKSTRFTNTKAILVHVWASDFEFPSVNEIPTEIRGVFVDKAITYIPDYVDTIADRILEVRTTTQKKLTKDVRPDIFISNRRVTGQTIAGRAFEALSPYYEVFLDTEASFSLAELETIVSKSTVFLLVYTDGFLSSEWCMKELRCAIANKVKIIIVRNYLDKIPAKFISDLKDVEDAFRTSPTIEWMAEFNTLAMRKLKTMLPVPRVVAAAMPSFFRNSNQLEGLKKGQFGVDKPLDFSKWNQPASKLFEAITFALGIQVSAVKLGHANNVNDSQASTFENLTYLEMSPAFTNVGVRSVALNCPNLKTLVINWSNVTDNAITDVVALCPNLTELDISNLPNLTDACFKDIGKLQNLTILKMSSLKVNGSGFHHLSLPSLKYLDTSSNNTLQNEFVVSLKGCSNLEYLDLQGSDTHAGDLLPYCTNLKELLLANVSTKEDFDQVTKHCSNLLRFECQLGDVDDEVLKNFADGCSKLEKMFVPFCTKFSDEGVIYFASKLNSLKEINFLASSITDAAIDVLTSSNPNLEILILSHCASLTDKSLEFITSRCKDLKKLWIGGEWKVTDQGAQSIKQLTKLEEFDCQGYWDQELSMEVQPKVQIETIEEIQANCRKLKEIRFPGWEQNYNESVGEPEIEEEVKKILATDQNDKLQRKYVDKKVPNIDLSFPLPLESTQRTKFALCFANNTGTYCASFLAQEFTRSNASFYTVCADGTNYDLQQIETAIKNSVALVVVLSQDSLKEPVIVKAMEAAIAFDIGSIMVHDAETCFFPPRSVQPASCHSLFDEKAITFLEDYADSVASEILAKVRKQMQQLSKTHGHTEDIRTKMFLSHKRITAQHIAGRIWETFRNRHNIFLDSEAKFVLHDLDLLVANTEIFIMILSPGYFESPFCCMELDSAIRNNKKFVIIRNYQYQIPNTFPAHLRSDPQIVKRILNESITLTWMAEYHSQAMEKLKAKVLGANDEVLQDLENDIRNIPSNVPGYNAKCFNSSHPLVLKNWSGKVDDLILGLQISKGCKIQSVDVSDYYLNNDESFVDLIKYCPDLVEFVSKDVKRSSDITDRGVFSASKYMRNLTKFVCDCSPNFTDVAVSWLAYCCPTLTHVELQRGNLTVAHVRSLAACKDLKYLQTTLTPEGLDVVATSFPKLSALIAWTTGDIGKALQKLVDNQCALLVRLEIYDYTWTKPVLSHVLDKCLQLESLNLSGISFVDAKILKKASQLKQVQKLELANVNGTDEMLQIVGNEFRSLQHLNINNWTNVTSAGFAALGKLHDLQHIELQECSNLTDSDIASWASGTNKLRCVHLENCTSITDNGLISLAAMCPLVTELYLVGCQIGNEAYKCFANVERLDTECFDDTGLQSVVDNCKHLKWICVHAPLSKESRVYLKERNPTVELDEDIAGC